MNNFTNSSEDPYLKQDDSDADAFAILSLLVLFAITLVYYLSG